MPKGTHKQRRQKQEPRRAYLVRPYMCVPMGEACGYYFSRQEAEEVKRELEEQHPDELFAIEELQRSSRKREEIKQRLEVTIYEPEEE